MWAFEKLLCDEGTAARQLARWFNRLNDRGTPFCAQYAGWISSQWLLLWPEAAIRAVAASAGNCSTQAKLAADSCLSWPHIVSGEQVVAIEVHDLVPCSHEVAHELLVRVVARVGLRQCAKLRVRP